MISTKKNRGQLRAYAELPVRPWFFAAPIHAGKSNANLLTLATIQTEEAYRTLAEDGVLVGDSTRGWEEFQEAYEWMHRAMDERGIPGDPGGLLWLWDRPSRYRIRHNAKNARGEVLLTVRVARERALLSDFSDWHSVLCRSLHVPQLPGESDEDWHERNESIVADFDSRAADCRQLTLNDWPSALRVELESSWDAIFDSRTWSADSVLQATLRDLRAADVIRAVRII